MLCANKVILPERKKAQKLSSTLQDKKMLYQYRNTPRVKHYNL
jgi:hypothetical protein